MKILCIEDYEEKYTHIETVLSDITSNIVWRKSYQEGLSELKANTYDILLLDMSMPICEFESNTDNFDNYAGMTIMREIKRKRYKIKVIIITGFSDFEKGSGTITLNELEQEIKEKYSDIFLECIKYDSTSVEWQERLIKLLKE